MRNGGSSWGWWAEDSARRFLNGDLDVGLKEKRRRKQDSRVFGLIMEGLNFH